MHSTAPRASLSWISCTSCGTDPPPTAAGAGAGALSCRGAEAFADADALPCRGAEALAGPDEGGALSCGGGVGPLLRFGRRWRRRGARLSEAGPGLGLGRGRSGAALSRWWGGA